MKINGSTCSNCRIIKSGRKLKYQCAMVAPYMDLEEICDGLGHEDCSEYDPILIRANEE